MAGRLTPCSAGRDSTTCRPTSPASVVAIGVFDGVHYGHRAVVGQAVAHGRAPRRARSSSSPSTRTPTRSCGPARTRAAVHPRPPLRAARRARRRRRLHPAVHPRARRAVARGLRRRMCSSPASTPERSSWGRTSASATAPPATPRPSPSSGRTRGFVVDAVPLIAGEGGVVVLHLHPRPRRAPATSPRRRTPSAARTGSRARSSTATTAAASSATRPPTSRPRRTPPSPPTASTPHGWSARPYTEHAETLPAAVSVGTNPTFDGVERRVEAYVLDRDDLDLYGAPRRARLRRRASAARRGSTARTPLVARMAVDVDEARPPCAARAAASPELRATERWFIRRGLPMFVEDYSAGRDVWTRALPALVVLFVLSLGGVGDPRRARSGPALLRRRRRRTSLSAT